MGTNLFGPILCMAWGFDAIGTSPPDYLSSFLKCICIWEQQMGCGGGVSRWIDAVYHISMNSLITETMYGWWVCCSCVEGTRCIQLAIGISSLFAFLLEPWAWFWSQRWCARDVHYLTRVSGIVQNQYVVATLHVVALWSSPYIVCQV